MALLAACFPKAQPTGILKETQHSMKEHPCDWHPDISLPSVSLSQGSHLLQNRLRADPGRGDAPGRWLPLTVIRPKK